MLLMRKASAKQADDDKKNTIEIRTGAFIFYLLTLRFKVSLLLNLVDVHIYMRVKYSLAYNEMLKIDSPGWTSKMQQAVHTGLNYQ